MSPYCFKLDTAAFANSIPSTTPNCRPVRNIAATRAMASYSSTLKRTSGSSSPKGVPNGLGVAAVLAYYFSDKCSGPSGPISFAGRSWDGSVIFLKDIRFFCLRLLQHLFGHLK